MNSHWSKHIGAALTAIACVTLASTGFTQSFYEPFHDPKNEDPVAGGSSATNPFNFAGANPFMSIIIGTAGSYTYGPMPAGAYPFGSPDHDLAGAIAFITLDGSRLDPFDDLVALTGATAANTNLNNPPFAGQLPLAPSNRFGYASIRVIDSGGTTTDSRLGEETAYGVTPTANFRRMTLTTAPTGANVTCQVDLIGATIRMEWTLTNTAAEPAQLGFRFAHSTNMRHPFDGVPLSPGKRAMVLTDRGRNLVLQGIWTRGVSTDFPSFMDFYWAQSIPYPAMRFRMQPDPAHLDATPVDRVGLGSNLDSVWNFTPITVFHNSALMMFWDPILVPAGGSRTIVHYVELGHMITDYALPYAVTTEATPLIGFSKGELNNLFPNPFQIVGYVDNQYARFNQQVTLESVEVTLELPEHLSFAPGHLATKVTGPVTPNAVEQVQWDVIADGIEPGVYPYTLTFDPTGPSTAPTRVISNHVIVGLTPVVDLRGGPNLITIPWSLPVNTFAGNGLGGFTAYDWDPIAQAYAVTGNIRRGAGQWLTSGVNPPPHTIPNALSFGDETLGQFRVVTKRRWNLLGNPYPYPIKISQLIGVSATDPTESLTWEQMVNRGYIRPYIFTYNPDMGQYQLFQGDQYILPGKGFWMYNASANDLDIIWPSVLLPGLPGSNLLQIPTEPGPGEWKIDLNLQTMQGADSGNQFGVTVNQYNADMLSMFEPPVRPGGGVQLYISNGEGLNITKMNRMFKPKTFVNRFTAIAEVPAGTSTITWNFSRGVPANATISMRDMKTNQVTQMRLNNGRTGYTFTSNTAETRRFEITVHGG